MSDRRLEAMRIDTLVPALRNPKRHDLDALRESVARFGFTSPPEIDERTGRLVSGHGRVQLLQIEMGAGDEVPDGITVDTDGVWMVPVLRGWASKDDTEADAYLIAHNRQAELGGWDDHGLADFLGELRDTPAALLGLGYTPYEVDDLFHRLAPPPSLDDLADDHGEHDESDLWPVIRIQVPPETRDAFVAARVEGESDADLLARLLGVAGS